MSQSKLKERSSSSCECIRCFFMTFSRGNYEEKFSCDPVVFIMGADPLKIIWLAPRELIVRERSCPFERFNDSSFAGVLRLGYFGLRRSFGWFLIRLDPFG